MPEHICPPGLNFLLVNPLRNWGQNPGKIMKRFIREGDVVLDVGCGPGHFTIAAAEIVGAAGCVIAADVQEKMLEKVRIRALKAGVLPRIRLHLASPDKLGVQGPVDFVLAFWMAHEVRERAEFFSDIYKCMKPGATLLLAEPKGHVGEKGFAGLKDIAEKSGLRVLRPERVPLSRAVLFLKVQEDKNS